MSEKYDVISLIVSLIISIGSGILLLIRMLRHDPDIGNLIFYAWLSLFTQQNIFQKINKEQQMKVLYSPGYGAGWSTWNDSKMAIDKDLIELFERGCTEDEMVDLCIKKGYTDGVTNDPPYMGGFGDLVVTEVPKGCTFRINEYDGSEYIDIFEEGDWFYAED